MYITWSLECTSNSVHVATCESGFRRVIYTPLGLSVQRGTAERTRNRGTAVSTYILYSDMSSPRGGGEAKKFSTQLDYLPRTRKNMTVKEDRKSDFAG